VQPWHLPSMRALTSGYQMQGNLRMAEKLLRLLLIVNRLIRSLAHGDSDDEGASPKSA